MPVVPALQFALIPGFLRPPFHLELPAICLIALVGASESGKSAWVARHFLPIETLSSDRLRAWVSDSESGQSAMPDAFDALHFLADKRLTRGKLTVVDATNVQAAAHNQKVEPRGDFATARRTADSTVCGRAACTPSAIWPAASSPWALRLWDGSSPTPLRRVHECAFSALALESEPTYLRL